MVHNGAKVRASRTPWNTKKGCKYHDLQPLCDVGMTRLELATSRPPDACANQLRYIPHFFKSECKVSVLL